MELSLLQKLLIEPSKLIQKIEATGPDESDGSKQYQPENHKVADESERKKREIKFDTGTLNADGTPQMRTEYEEVARITTAAQKQIVNWAVQIAAGVPVELTADVPEGDKAKQKMLDMLKKTLKDNKMEYLDQEILRLTQIYKICAEIWYSEEVDPEYWNDIGSTNSRFRMRLMIMSEESGDRLYPIKNSVGDMIALGRAYSLKDDEDKDVKMFDLFLQDSIITYKQAGSGWEESGTKKIPYNKANFIVHQQARREWEDVQPKIERLETLDSNIADQNDATGSPIIAGKGIKGLGKRGETGKVFDLENDGDIKIIESQRAPDAIKMERENLVKGIFDETNTPQISFSEAQGFGANVPGITIKLLFLPATLKALSRQSGGWGMSIQRRYNFLKAAMAVINVDVKPALSLDVSPRFSIYMPENTTEKYENIVKLVSAGLLSKKKAIEMLALTNDAAEEIKQIEVEAAEVPQKPVGYK